MTHQALHFNSRGIGRATYLITTDNSAMHNENYPKLDKINEILSEFDNLQPDMKISSLCSTLDRLGSLWNVF